MTDISFNKSPYLRILFRLIFSTFGIYFLFLLGKGLWFLFSPFLLALCLAAFLHPHLSRLEASFHWKRPSLILWILGFFFLSVTAFLFLVLPYLWRESLSFFIKTQEWTDDFLPYLSLLEETIETFFPFLSSSWTEELSLWTKSFLLKLIDQGGSFLQVLPHFFLQCVIFLLASYFIAGDFSSIESYWNKKSTSDVRYLLSMVKSTITVAFTGYLKAQLLLSLAVFAILSLGFFLSGQAFPLLYGLLIAVLDFIPMIGAGIILLPWTALAFLLGNTQEAFVLLLLWVVTSLFRRIMEPKVLGEQTGLSPLLSLASMYVGLQIWGVVGLILAPILLLVLMHLFSFRIFAGLFHDIELVSLDIYRLFQEE